MFNKLGNSQTTVQSSCHLNKSSILFHKGDGNSIKNPFKETLPIKFPINKIRKQTQMHMLVETDINPERSCIRNFKQANRSHINDDQTYKKKFNPGECQKLKFESSESSIRIRTYEDIGVVNNQKRVFGKLSYKADPIIAGERNIQFNSSLQKVWNEPRKHRDNGIFCEKTLQWNPKISRREPYQTVNMQGNKKAGNKSYKEIYQSSKNFKSIFN